MKSSKGIAALFGGDSLATVAFFTVLLSGGVLGGKTAEANQPPPPPTYYTLTVNKSGGDSTCEVRIDSPDESAWRDSPGIIQNDDYTHYTHERTYEITYNQPVLGLTYTKVLYDGTNYTPVTIDYHVENFNCTNAAIHAASAAGVTLPDGQNTCDHWTHSFSGQSPGTLGERLNE